MNTVMNVLSAENFFINYKLLYLSNVSLCLGSVTQGTLLEFLPLTPLCLWPWDNSLMFDVSSSPGVLNSQNWEF